MRLVRIRYYLNKSDYNFSYQARNDVNYDWSTFNPDCLYAGDHKIVSKCASQ